MLGIKRGNKEGDGMNYDPDKCYIQALQKDFDKNHTGVKSLDKIKE